MEEKQYPRFMVSKNVEIKMTPQMGIIECNYRHLVNAFGQPSYSKDSGDEFDGVERVAWHIQFETVLWVFKKKLWKLICPSCCVLCSRVAAYSDQVKYHIQKESESPLLTTHRPSEKGCV